MQRLFILLLLAGLQLSAAMLQYQVTGNLTGLSGPGLITFSLSTFGTPNNNVTAIVSNLSFTDGSYDFGVGTPALDVVRTGSTVTFGGVDTARFYDINALNFGTSISFLLTLSGADVNGAGSGDGWSFSTFISEDSPGLGFEYFILDIPPSGAPVVDEFSTMNVDPVPEVPEPGTLATLGAGLVALALYNRQRRRSAHLGR